MQSVKRELVEICKLLYVRGLAKAWGGNVSVRKDKNHIIITPRETSLLDVSLNNLVLTKLDGEVMNEGIPSTELPMHCAIYHSRPEIVAIVHIHSLYSTIFAVLEKPIELLTAEGQIAIGKLPIVKYAEPGSKKLAELVADHLKENSVCLLARHGIVAVSTKSLKDAYYLAELVEETAELNFLIKLIN